MPETSDVDALTASSRLVKEGEVIGTTEQVAEWMGDYLQADVFPITTTEPYVGTHEEIVTQIENELESQNYPKIANHIENLDQFDTIFLGYPIQVYGLPSVIYSFLNDTDFSGKTIIPFSTHGGSGFTGTIETLKTLEPQATIEENNGLSINRDEVQKSQKEIEKWLTDIGY